MQIVTIALGIVAELAKIASDAIANADKTEAEAAAALKAALAAAVLKVDGLLGDLDAARARADAELAAAAPTSEG